MKVISIACRFEGNINCMWTVKSIENNTEVSRTYESIDAGAILDNDTNDWPSAEIKELLWATLDLVAVDDDECVELTYYPSINTIANLTRETIDNE